MGWPPGDNSASPIFACSKKVPTEKRTPLIFDKALKKKKLAYLWSGFQRNHSTVTQLCFLAHQWHMVMDEGANIQSVFLDLSKAYDRVSISGLLSKLSLIGFDYPSLEWCANFLQHRQQCVRLQSITSTFQTPLSGIPQGTVLGPVLFLIFTNDLSELIQNQASFFADDTTLHATDKSLVSSCVSLSGDLDRAANWADRWGMLFSAPKSKHLPIGREAQQSPSVFMKGALISHVRTHKHLRLIFNSSLTWNDHISNLYTTCARMTGILRRLDGSIPSSSMKIIQLAFALA